MENQKTKIEIERLVTTVTKEMVTVELPAYRKHPDNEYYYKVIAEDNVIEVCLFDHGANFYKPFCRTKEVLGYTEITEAEFHNAVFKARSIEALIVAEVFGPVNDAFENISTLVQQ